MHIKAGSYEYDELIQMADDIMQEIETAYETSTLPDAPDKAAMEQVLVNMRYELYQ